MWIDPVMAQLRITLLSMNALSLDDCQRVAIATWSACSVLGVITAYPAALG